MIREFSVKAKPSNNKARVAFIISMLIAFLLISTSTLVEKYAGLVSLGGVIALSFALVLYTRYVAPVYYYDITYDSDGSAVLVIRQQTGKRYTTLCRIFLREIVEIEKITAEQRKGRHTPSDVRKYFYLPTLAPDSNYILTVNGRYEKAEVSIEVSDEFADLLRQYCREARSLFSEYDD